MSAALKLASVDKTLAALADPTRRGVIDLLRRNPRRAGELSSALSMTPAAMSRHLRVLRQTGLVEEDSLGEDLRVRVYTLRREPFAKLSGWLKEVEGFWDGQLSAFKKHVERK
jgi:DNA-binding transcriptional ArsR family regulator